jgi:hypothetical protein
LASPWTIDDIFTHLLIIINIFNHYNLPFGNNTSLYMYNN